MEKINFVPIQAKEKTILDLKMAPGHLYFATDSGRIFIDTPDKRVSMGGSGASVIYSFSNTIQERPDGYYWISRNDLENEEVDIKKGDLIINNDGRFFKVFSENKDINILICELLAVSGSGGGGSEGPAGPEDDKKIQVEWHNVQYSFVAGTPYYISFTANSKKDTYLTVEYKVVTETSTVETKSLQIKSGEKTSVEVGSKMSTSGSNAVYFTFTGANSYTYTQDFKRIKAIDFKIEQDNNNFTNCAIYKNVFNYYINAYGLTEKTLHVAVDDNIIHERTLEAKDYESLPVEIGPETLKLAAGVHTITAYLTTLGIESNKVTTDFIYHPDGTADTTYVLVTAFPEQVYSYETPIVKYWVWDTAKTAGNTNAVEWYINNELIETVYPAQQIGAGKDLEQPLSNLQVGINSINIKSGSGARAFEINVLKSDIFEPTTDSAILLLNTEGRTNNTSLERRLDWKYTRDNQTISANLNNFNWYNNGWVLDDTKRTCLRISNGASLTIPLKLFKDSQPTVGGFTIEFEFKPYNLYSYQLLTTSASSTGEDEDVEINREFDSSKATIKYIVGEGANAYGFCLGTQDAYFRLSDGTNVAARYKDEEIINIAMVVNAAKEQMFIYVNGIMSGMTSYTRTSGELPLGANTIQINSDFCDLDLYNIRIYEKALSSKEIVQNYISSKKDIALYNANALSVNNTINLNDLIEYNTANPENATIPYMIITTTAPDILPYNKSKDDILVDVDFVNPSLDYKFNLGQYTEDEYLHKAPSFKATKVVLNVQGTSSQKYPRKNFKAKFLKGSGTLECSNKKVENKSLSKIYLDSNIGEKTFTWKADFMDSSGSHNTGFASFVKLLYKNHPLDYYEGTSGVYQNKYRTTIYGFPMLVFHKTSNGQINFVGKYNFNLDKGCDDTLGFTHEGQNKILNKPYEEVAECWEFGNNQGGRCSFRGQPFDYGYNYETETGKLNIGDDLEVRYHINKDAIEQALEGKAEDEITPISDKQAFDILLGGTSEGNHPNGYGNLEKLFLWLKDSNFLFDLESATDQAYLKHCLNKEFDIVATDIDYQNFIKDRKNKFIDEYSKHLNMEYSLVYYIMTELLIQYDSRGKNMMLGTWGPLETNGEHIWFPMYYDIDTQLGVDNSGIPSWEYSVEPSSEKHFSTSNSILWTCFGEAFKDSIQQKYVELRGGNLSIEKLNGYYEFNPAVSNSEAMNGILPISFINADQYYKYIAPSILDTSIPSSGYIGDDVNSNPVKKFTSGYFYCLQGTRDLHRALFLRNRFNYYDSMWMAGAYNPATASDSTMRIRITSRQGLDELNSTTVVKITPKLDQYVLAWADESKTGLKPKKAKSGEVVEFDIAENLTLQNYDKQLIYFGGSEYILDFGDLSLLYINELEFPTTSVASIVLGNENERYSNKNISFQQIQGINNPMAPKRLLKNYDLTNLTALDSSLSINTAPKLEVFKALGTNLTSVEFADGVSLQKLYLPETINKLSLVETSQLDKIVYNKSDILDENGKQTKDGMYIENVVFTHPEAKIDVTRMNNIKIIGGNFNSDSYEFLNKVVDAKLAIKNYNSSLEGYGANLAIHMERVNWSPYIKLGEGAIYNKEKAYYIANNNFTLEVYAYVGDTEWNKLIAEERLYQFDDSSYTTISDLSLLDKLIENSNFTNITTTEDVGLPILTGDIFVDNTQPISEADIANYYNIKFPGLKIFARNVTDSYRTRFVDMTNNVEKELFAYRYETINDNIIPPSEENVPLPSHHDFVGWRLQGTTQIYRTAADFESLKFSESKKEYVFELVYKKHTYTFTFLDTSSGYSEKVYVDYDENLVEPNKQPWRKEAEKSLPLDKRFGFKGWTSEKLSVDIVDISQLNSLIVNLNNKKAEKDETFYALFVEESVYDSVLNEKYFRFEEKTINEIDGYKIVLTNSLKPKGKITLPVIYNNKPVISISGEAGYFIECEITHIFWDNKNPQRVMKIEDQAFQVVKPFSSFTSSLVYFDFIDSIEEIGKYAFDCQTELINTSLPKELQTIGDFAFRSCKVNFKVFDEKIKTIGDSSFIGSIGHFKTLEFGDSVKTIGPNAFASYTFGNDNQLTTIIIGSGIETIGVRAFEGQSNTNPNIYTIREIRINKAEDEVEGSPWGAVGVTPIWEG